MPKGTLFIVMAPSGAGKTSLVNALVDQDQHLCVSVSYTTRTARPGETNGEDYHFVSDKEFMAMLEKGDFLESAVVYGNHYGTSQAWVDSQLHNGLNVILEIDWQGAEQIRKLMPEVCSIFILPPSLDVLQQRLKERKQDDADTITRRMHQARDQISHVAEADFIVVNEHFETALADIRAIIRSRSLTVLAQQKNLSALLTSLSR